MLILSWDPLLLATLYDVRGSHTLSPPKCDTVSYGLKSIKYLGPNLWNSLKDLRILILLKSTRLICIHNHIFYAAQFYKYLILVLSMLGMLYLVF